MFIVVYDYISAEEFFLKQSKFDPCTLGFLVQAQKEKKDKEKLRKLTARDRKIIRQCVKVRLVKSFIHI